MEISSVEAVETVYDIIRSIKDPEKPETLEDLSVVNEEDVTACFVEDYWSLEVVFTPTVPHCSLATLIGLTIRVKLMRDLPWKHKLDIRIKEGSHATVEEITKQINDKERVAAAMENPNLQELVETCIGDDHLQ